MLLYSLRTRLVLTEHGPIVVNLRVRRLAWGDLVDLDCRIVSWGFEASFVERSGRRVRPWALFANADQAAWFEATTDMISERCNNATGCGPSDRLGAHGV